MKCLVPIRIENSAIQYNIQNIHAVSLVTTGLSLLFANTEGVKPFCGSEPRIAAMEKVNNNLTVSHSDGIQSIFVKYRQDLYDFIQFSKYSYNIHI
jgi:hypothetical protein